MVAVSLKKKRKKEKREIVFIEPGKKVLNLILKSDVLGSLEAIEQVLKNLPQEKVGLRILKKEVGEITEDDVKMAQIAKARLIGFRIKTNPLALKLAENQKIKIINFDIIYDLVQAVRQIMEKILVPKEIRIDLGKFKTSIVFLNKKNRQIIGGKVIEGEVRKGACLRFYVMMNK